MNQAKKARIKNRRRHEQVCLYIMMRIKARVAKLMNRSMKLIIFKV